MLWHLIATSYKTWLADIKQGFSDDESQVGLRAVCYYMTTTLIAVTLGILLTITIRWLVNILGFYLFVQPIKAMTWYLFRPGLANTEEELEQREGRNTTTTDTLLDLLTNCFPPNLIQVRMKNKPQKKYLHIQKKTTDTLLVLLSAHWFSPNLVLVIIFS